MRVAEKLCATRGKMAKRRKPVAWNQNADENYLAKTPPKSETCSVSNKPVPVGLRLFKERSGGVLTEGHARKGCRVPGSAAQRTCPPRGARPRRVQRRSRRAPRPQLPPAAAPRRAQRAVPRRSLSDPRAETRFVPAILARCQQEATARRAAANQDRPSKPFVKITGLFCLFVSRL